MAILESVYQLETLIFSDSVRAINNAATVVNHCRPTQATYHRMTLHKASLPFKKNSYLVAA